MPNSFFLLVWMHLNLFSKEILKMLYKNWLCVYILTAWNELKLTDNKKADSIIRTVKCVVKLSSAVHNNPEVYISLCQVCLSWFSHFFFFICCSSQNSFRPTHYLLKSWIKSDESTSKHVTRTECDSRALPFVLLHTGWYFGEMTYCVLITQSCQIKVHVLSFVLNLWGLAHEAGRRKWTLPDCNQGKYWMHCLEIRNVHSEDELEPLIPWTFNLVAALCFE